MVDFDKLDEMIAEAKAYSLRLHRDLKQADEYLDKDELPLPEWFEKVKMDASLLSAVSADILEWVKANGR